MSLLLSPPSKTELIINENSLSLNQTCEESEKLLTPLLHLSPALPFLMSRAAHLGRGSGMILPSLPPCLQLKQLSS